MTAQRQTSTRWKKGSDRASPRLDVARQFRPGLRNRHNRNALAARFSTPPTENDVDLRRGRTGVLVAKGTSSRDRIEAARRIDRTPNQTKTVPPTAVLERSVFHGKSKRTIFSDPLGPAW
jgi:hypothetical protein